MEINERVDFGAHVNEAPMIQEAARATETKGEEAIAFEGEAVRVAEPGFAYAVAQATSLKRFNQPASAGAAGGGDNCRPGCRGFEKEGTFINEAK